MEPLAVKEISGNARSEVFALLFLVLALRLAAASRWLGAALLYGGVLSGPLWLWTTLLPMARILRAKALVGLGLGLAAHWLHRHAIESTTLEEWLGLPSGWPPLDFIGASLLPSLDATLVLLATRQESVPFLAALAIWLALMIRRTTRPPDTKGLPEELLYAAGGYLFLAPQVMPWSFLLVSYLAAFSFNRGWVLFPLTAPITYFALDGGQWSFWLGFIQYFLPYAILAFFALGRSGARALGPRRGVP